MAGKLFFILVVFVGLVVVGVLSMANLTTAQATLTSSQANVIQAQTNLVSQCITGFMVVISLVASIMVGLGIGILRSKFLQPSTTQPRWVSGPNAHWQRLDAPAQRQLSIYQDRPVERQQVLVVSDEEENDFSLQGWGF